MKYNQPFGISNPEAPYINGDPSTGTMGSIPPAASIEYPQREIVAAINGARKQDLSGPQFTPANTDLAQLARAIQSSLLHTARDTGTTNFYACALQPPLVAYFEGFEVTLKIGNTNTGPSVLNVNSVGNKNIVNPDGSPIAPGLLHQSAYACFKYDGVNFQTVWTQKAAGEPIYLLAPRTFYVNATIGNDTWDGTTATHGIGTIGPFQTLQRAADEITKYNLNNYSITIIVADGTYSNVSLKKYSGSGQVFWIGNTANPSAVVVSAGVDKNAVEAFGAADVSLNGFKVTTIGGAPFSSAACGIYTSTDTTLTLNSIDFGQVAGAHMLITRGSYVATGFSAFKITGSTGVGRAGANTLGAHLYVYHAGDFGGNWLGTPGGATLSIPAAVNLGFFVIAELVSICAYGYTSMTGAANVTAKKFEISSNSVFYSLGGGVSYLPGNVAGTVATGGQYV